MNMDKITEVLKKAESVAVMGHISEDPDAVGSVFAAADVLSRLGKKVTCFMSEPVNDNLSFIMRDYTVFGEDMPTDEFDVCLCLDSGDIERLGKRIAIFNKSQITVNIDHHYTNTNFAQYNFVNGDAAATGEILYTLLGKLGEINQYTAKCLYTAIAADTGSFKYSSAKPSTLRVAAQLLEYDIDHADIARLLFDTEELSVMRLRAAVMNNVKSYYGGKLNLVAIDGDLYEKYGVAENAVGDFVDIPRRIKGCDVAVCLKKRDDKIKVSLRSNGRVNVAEAALKLNGGGHKMAAGAAVNASMEETEKLVVELFEGVI